ncbi:TIGR04282 family arsenosugar biosynthesis glycosyltransferase [uncultured Sphingomonas sp.]|uniref:TIGR04282 family arsenosugar biosynthesis glycosyltransferase n=1 Tax=uncultured Sphingomonas sp. TaxID=158754 RepID=UPI0035CC8921
MSRPSEPRVAVFARYPTPGRAKTRLIPALGAAGSAALHRQLVERTLRAVKASGLPFELRTTGADAVAFQDWLGTLSVVDQGDGDLGERLARAGPPYPTLFIGSDAPDLSPGHLSAAAAELDRAPAVIGRAEDGGYWLLGLARAVPGVFDGVDWGTDAVFAQTLARLRTAGIEPVLLSELADLDRPQDLARWPDLAR